MANLVDVSAIQLVDEDGKFDDAGLDRFTQTLNLGEAAVVSIFGPQSSGKSTLMNHVFHTNFSVMDAKLAAQGTRSRTTQGIWLGKCVNIEPCSIAIDIEGTDGSHRGDDVAFEKKSALFAIAVSGVVIINMSYKDIGLENAANRPLLKIIFQMMMRLFPEHRATLFFVIRDSEVECSEVLVEHMKKDINKIYDSIKLTGDVKSLSDLFDVEVATFSHYRLENTKFNEQVVGFRQKIVDILASRAIARDRKCLLPTSAFSDTWQIIQGNKDLDLPTLTDMIATTRCVNIADAKFSQFSMDQDWLETNNDATTTLASNFGKSVSAIINRYVSEYNAETIYFEGTISEEKLRNLLQKMLTLVWPAYQSILKSLRCKSLDEFKEAFSIHPRRKHEFAKAAEVCKENYLSRFDQQYKASVITLDIWSSFIAEATRDKWISKNRNKLASEMDANVASARVSQLSKLTSLYEEWLAGELSPYVKRHLINAGDYTWQSISVFLLKQTDLASDRLTKELSGFKLDKLAVEDILAAIGLYARKFVQEKAKEHVQSLELRMNERFRSLFFASMPVSWTGHEDIKSITDLALSSCVNMVSVMAIERLDGEPDQIGKILSNSLSPGRKNIVIKGSPSLDPLSSDTWEGVPSERTLITPAECKRLWSAFCVGAEDMIVQATRIQCEVLRANKATESAAEANKTAAQATKSAAESDYALKRERAIRLMMVDMAINVGFTVLAAFSATGATLAAVTTGL